MYIDFEEVDINFEEVVLDHLEKDANYHPFPSMMHALLFMLVNSPRPIVSNVNGHIACTNLIYCETNLRFILFICKKCDPSLPSLDVIKRFVLPAFIPPKKVLILVR